MEAIAACRTLEFGSEIGIDKLIVKGDSDIVVKALGNLDKGLSSYGLLINDTALFLGFFSKFSYSYTRRVGNRVIWTKAQHSPSLTRFKPLVG